MGSIVNNYIVHVYICNKCDVVEYQSLSKMKKKHLQCYIIMATIPYEMVRGGDILPVNICSNLRADFVVVPSMSLSLGGGARGVVLKLHSSIIPHVRMWGVGGILLHGGTTTLIIIPAVRPISLRVPTICLVIHL